MRDYDDGYDDDYDDYSSGSSGLKIFFGISLIIFAIIALTFLLNYKFCFIPFMQGKLCKECPPGLDGPNCEINRCDRGKMVNGVCVCEPGFVGKTCRMQKNFGPCGSGTIQDDAENCFSKTGGCPCPNAYCTPMEEGTENGYYIRSSETKGYAPYMEVYKNDKKSICIGSDAAGEYIATDGSIRNMDFAAVYGSTKERCEEMLKEFGCTA